MATQRRSKNALLGRYVTPAEREEIKAWQYLHGKRTLPPRYAAELAGKAANTNPNPMGSAPGRTRRAAVQFAMLRTRGLELSPQQFVETVALFEEFADFLSRY